MQLIITSTGVRKALGGHPSKYAKQLTARFINGLSDYGSELQRGLIKFTLKAGGRRTLEKVHKRSLKTLLAGRRRGSPGRRDCDDEQINKQQSAEPAEENVCSRERVEVASVEFGSFLKE